MSSPKLHRRAASGGKRYCVLCKHHENKVLDDGTKITLHRLPGGKSQSEILRRKAWLRGLKLHRPDLPITDNTRLCILHFEHKTYNKRESVPKFFNLERCKTQEDNFLDSWLNRYQFLPVSYIFVYIWPPQVPIVSGLKCLTSTDLFPQLKDIWPPMTYFLNLEIFDLQWPTFSAWKIWPPMIYLISLKMIPIYLLFSLEMIDLQWPTSSAWKYLTFKDLVFSLKIFSL